MGKSILVTGGARSGKSRFAEKLMMELSGPVLYLATAKVLDDEMALRVEMHQKSRPAEWKTIEGYRGLGEIIRREGSKYQGILLDCVTIMVTNLLFDLPEFLAEELSRENIERAEQIVLEEAQALVAGIKETSATIVLVTNELGSGVVPEYPMVRAFRDIAGRINQYLAQEVDEVYLTVCGLPMQFK